MNQSFKISFFFFLLQQLVNLLFEVVQFFQHVIVVVGYHRVHEDGVDERHADDAAEDQQQAEVEPHDAADGWGRGRRDGVGDVVPALHGADAEDGVDGVQRRGEIGRRDVFEQAAVNEPEHDDQHEEAEQDAVRLFHGQLEPFGNLVEVGKEVQHTQEPERA